MTTEHKNLLFRLAAVLYADNNYEVAPKTIHRKIIESVLLSNNNKQLSIDGIIDYISENYYIQFDEAEILNIVTNPKEEGFLTHNRGEETYVCLSEKRKQALQGKISNKTIDFFICEFEKNNETLVTGTNVKELIYRFLYELLSTNIYSFKKLLDNKTNLGDLINGEGKIYTPVEREIVNSFLIWDNNEKNKAIFDIASYALEYCMISNNNVATSLHLSSLKNKIFYLDTNVVYRALGINGINRQNRTRTFLKKFLDAGEKLTISKFSEFEFKDSIRFYVDKLKKYPIKKLNPAVFKEQYFQNISAVFDFYHKWRIGKVNDSYELFEAYILGLYEAFKNEYKIIVDYKIPFDINDDETEKQITEISRSISSFKTSEGANHGYDSDFNDACNIHLVQIKRDGRNSNLFDVQYFLISTDQSLRRWDYQRSNITPIVILPSQWLSIILRYINRTSDDFRSFVSFLNLPNTETNIDSEKLHIILAGISEMTENFEQQSFLVKSIVQNKFEGILDKGTKDEEILEKTKKYVKTTLGEKLVELSGKHTELASEFEKHKEHTQQQIGDFITKSGNQSAQLVEKENELAKLRAELKEKKISERFSKWQRPAYFLLVVGLIIIVFMILQFCWKNSPYNLSYAIIRTIDALESDTQKNTLRTLMYAPILGLWLIGTFCWSRLVSTEKKLAKKKEIAEEFG